MQKETKQKGQHLTDLRRINNNSVIKAWMLEEQVEDSYRETEKCCKTKATMATYMMKKRSADVV